jgi:hypothetical protein
MAKRDAVVPIEQLDRFIHEIRGRKVMLDADLALIYAVPTKALNQAVKRNADRFPEDFVFQLTPGEFEALMHPTETPNLRSQSVASRAHGGRRYLPYAFTEHGAIMAATILNSPRAVQMSVFVVRAFVKMREMLLSQRDMAAKLRELERKLTERLDTHETAIVDVLREVMLLLNPPDEPPPPAGTPRISRERRAWHLPGLEERGTPCSTLKSGPVLTSPVWTSATPPKPPKAPPLYGRSPRAILVRES